MLRATQASTYTEQVGYVSVFAGRQTGRQAGRQERDNETNVLAHALESACSFLFPYSETTITEMLLFIY